MRKTTGYNSKFAQKWLTVVQLRFFVNYSVQCGATLVLQAMPFLRKFPKRYRAFQKRHIETAKMKWFPIHIIIKDLSFMMFYFVIMKYNLTNETYLPETISNFPGAPEMTLTNMIGASLFYNIIPLLLSLASYYPIVYLTRKLFKTRNLLSLITTGFFLTLTTPSIYLALSEWKHNDYYLKTAEIIAWALCFVSSIITYYLLNNNDNKSDEFEPITPTEHNK